MTTAPTPHLRALAEAAEGNGEHIYTHPRDSNKWRENEAWHRAASPGAVLHLLDSIHELEMQVLDLASENSILKRAETDELEARKPLTLSDDDRLRLRSDVARAIWDVMREHEDRCDHALEDVEPKHQVWDCADAAIETALGIIPRPNPLIARREVVAGGPVRVTRLHLTDEGRAALTSKATGPLPPARVDELMAEAGYLGASAESRADFINGLRHGELVHGIKET